MEKRSEKPGINKFNLSVKVLGENKECVSICSVQR